MSIADILDNIFISLAKDDELLSLLKVPSNKMIDIKKQIIEDKYPNDLISNNLTRICIYENPSTYHDVLENHWLEIDIYINKENNLNKEVYLIADRIIEILDEKKRALKNKPPILTGLGMHYYNMLPNMAIGDNNWTQFTLIFTYDYIK